jgi:hypothetical protein
MPYHVQQPWYEAAMPMQFTPQKSTYLLAQIHTNKTRTDSIHERCLFSCRRGGSVQVRLKHTHTPTYIHRYTHTHLHIHILIRRHTSTHTCRSEKRCFFLRAEAEHTHTNPHTHTHTNTHIRIQTCTRAEPRNAVSSYGLRRVCQKSRAHKRSPLQDSRTK